MTLESRLDGRIRYFINPILLFNRNKPEYQKLNLTKGIFDNES
jgi:hypothetical protein